MIASIRGRNWPARASRLWRNGDARALLLLALLWLIFFWRVLLPVGSARVSFVSGDFSAQNYAFSVYQFERLRAGEIALWNPYNYGGSPFLADVQASVFYPPRLLSMSLTALLGGGWRYESLQVETLLHTLVTSWLAYAFLRRITLARRGSRLGALAGALVWAYGGFLSGYPQLQANIMAAACWLPLQLLGALEATRKRGHIAYAWLALSGLALALSALAGHPQTTFFAAYLWLAYFTHLCWRARVGWRRVLVALVGLAVLAFALSAIILLPAAEFLQSSARASLTYADKANGFPLRDWLQLMLPGALSQWSPLYFGALGFTLALYALWRRLPGSGFWGGAAVVALLLSLGGNGFLYPILYRILPGLALFRQQERVAVLVAFAAAVLVALVLIEIRDGARARLSRRGLAGLVAILGGALLLAALETGAIATALQSAAFIAAALLAFYWKERAPAQIANMLVALLLAELLIFHAVNPNYSPLRSDGQLPGLAIALRHSAREMGYAQPARVDGVAGLGGNFGAAYALADIRGISPLYLRGPQVIIYQDHSINPIAWELFAVSHVFHDWRELPVPTAASRVVAAQEGIVYAHQLANPRHFAQFLPRYMVAESGEDALATLVDLAAGELREVAILETPLALPASNAAALYASAEVTDFAPERIELALAVPADALLSLALPYDGNWRARVDGAALPLQRAYGALTALVIPGGARALVLTYAPLSYHIGALISAIAWAGLLGTLALRIARRRR